MKLLLDPFTSTDGILLLSCAVNILSLSSTFFLSLSPSCLAASSHRTLLNGIYHKNDSFINGILIIGTH